MIYQLALALRDGLYLFITSFYPGYLEIIDTTGLWDGFEIGRIALTKLVPEYWGASKLSRSVQGHLGSCNEYTTAFLPGCRLAKETKTD